MGRVNPLAAVYTAVNLTNGMRYVGETSNYADRMSSYRTLARGRKKDDHRPFARAIMKYGITAFAFGILISSNDDPRIKDGQFRRKVEAYYIHKYDTTNPNRGYNAQNETPYDLIRKKRQSVKTTTKTKILKCDPILVHNIKDDSVFMYLGSESCATDLGISDRSIIISAIKKGKTVHNRTYFKVDYDKRIKIIEDVIRTKMRDTNSRGYRTNPRRKKSLQQYIDSIDVINDFCQTFGYKTVDVHQLIDEIKADM